MDLIRWFLGIVLLICSASTPGQVLASGKNHPFIRKIQSQLPVSKIYPVRINYAARAVHKVYVLNLLSTSRKNYQGWTRSEVLSELGKTIRIFSQCGVNFEFDVIDVDLGEFKTHSQMKGEFMDGTSTFNYSQFSRSNLRDGPVVVLVDKFVVENAPGYTQDFLAWASVDGMAYTQQVVSSVPFYRHLIDTAFVFRRSISQNGSSTYSTIAHELGHILLNAKHVEISDLSGNPFSAYDKSGNLMADGHVANFRGFSSFLNEEQCQAARAYRYP